MHNDALDRLTDYPFDRLRALLGPVPPAVGKSQILMQLGEPQHPEPPMISEIIARHLGEWAKYPPVPGSTDLFGAVADSLTRCYILPAGIIEMPEGGMIRSRIRDGERHHDAGFGGDGQRHHQRHRGPDGFGGLDRRRRGNRPDQRCS